MWRRKKESNVLQQIYMLRFAKKMDSPLRWFPNIALKFSTNSSLFRICIYGLRDTYCVIRNVPFLTATCFMTQIFSSPQVVCRPALPRDYADITEFCKR